MLPEAQLAAVLPTLPRIAELGAWCRAIGYHLLQGPPPGAPPGSPSKPLWPGGAPQNGARFTPLGAFDSVYLASDPVTALLEVTGIFLHARVPAFTLKANPWALFAVEGIIDDVIDLCDPSVQSTLATNLQELTGDWAYGQELHRKGLGPLPPTQLLGKVAFASGCIAGIKYPSSKNVGKGTALVVFSQRLTARSYLQVYDPTGFIRDRLS